MLAAAERLTAVEGFGDVADLLRNARHKDRDAAILFQREALATVLERATDAVVDAQGEPEDLTIEVAVDVGDNTTKVIINGQVYGTLVVDEARAIQLIVDDAESDAESDDTESNGTNDTSEKPAKTAKAKRRKAAKA